MRKEVGESRPAMIKQHGALKNKHTRRPRCQTCGWWLPGHSGRKTKDGQREEKRAGRVGRKKFLRRVNKQETEGEFGDVLRRAGTSTQQIKACYSNLNDTGRQGAPPPIPPTCC